MSRIVSILNNVGPAYHTHFGFQNENNAIYKRYNDSTSGTFTKAKLCELISTTIDAHMVIIAFSGSISENWSNVPTDQWYNRPSKIFKEKGLPFLNTKKYIRVVQPFMSVSICKHDKKSNITILDILFATRALACDESRTYDSFELISFKNNILILEPDIDNYSS